MFFVLFFISCLVFCLFVFYTRSEIVGFIKNLVIFSDSCRIHVLDFTNNYDAFVNLVIFLESSKP